METADTGVVRDVVAAGAEPSGAVVAQPEKEDGAPRQRVLFWLLLVGAAFAHLVNLGHTYIAPWDEVFHAVVAEHLALHPLTPTLYETAALSGKIPGSDNWQYYTHIWLHIPPLGMWASALSMRVLGDTPLALRLPGALFILLGMAVTYSLGRRLFGPVAGLVGAAFVGFAPYPLLLAQGYVFGDITDTPLLLLTPLVVLALVLGYRTGRLRWPLVAGIAQGLCYLDKGGLGLAPAGVALALALAERFLPAEEGWRPLGIRAPILYLAAAFVVAAPYNLYIARAFPATNAIESHAWSQAFFGNLEGWGRPLDYHWTIYLFAMYGSAFALLIVSALVTLVWLAVRRRTRAELVVVVWIASLYLPLTLAVSKAAPFTLAAVPAVGLIIGHFVTRGLRATSPLARVATLGIVLGTAGAAILFMLGNVVQRRVHLDMNYHHQSVLLFLPQSALLRFAPYAVEVACCLVATGACWYTARHVNPAWLPFMRSRAMVHGSVAGGGSVARWPVRFSSSQRRPARLAVTAGLVCAVLALGVYWARFDWQVAGQTFSPSPAPALGTLLAAHTPTNATILMTGTGDRFVVDGASVMNARLMVMFWAHRDVYAVATSDTTVICPLVHDAAASNSPTYLLTTQPYIGQALGTSQTWTLYQPRCP